MIWEFLTLFFSFQRLNIFIKNYQKIPSINLFIISLNFIFYQIFKYIDLLIGYILKKYNYLIGQLLLMRLRSYLIYILNKIELNDYYQTYQPYIYLGLIGLIIHITKLILLGLLVFIIFNIYIYLSINYCKKNQNQSILWIWNKLILIIGSIIYYIYIGIKNGLYICLSICLKILTNNYNIILLLFLYLYINYEAGFWELWILTKKIIYICQFDQYILKVIVHLTYISLYPKDWFIFLLPFNSFTKTIGFAILDSKYIYNWYTHYFTASHWGNVIHEFLKTGPTFNSWPPNLYVTSGQYLIDFLIVIGMDSWFLWFRWPWESLDEWTKREIVTTLFIRILFVDYMLAKIFYSHVVLL